MSEIKTILRRSWQSHFWTNFATTGVLTLSFCLIIGSVLVNSNLSRFLTVWGDEIQITLYLRDEIAPAQREELEKAIRGEDAVESATYIDKAGAAKTFEKSLSSLGPSFLSAIKNENENPFPASYLIKLASDKKTPERVEALAKKYAAWAGVEDVSYGQEWLKNYSLLIKISRGLALLITLVILVASVFTVSNSIRASLAARREEVEIQELVGATREMIRRPFVIEGAFQGALAAVVALLGLGVIYALTLHLLENWVGASTFISSFGFLNFWQILGFILMGFTVGAAGSYVCVVRINTGWAATDQEMAK